MVEVSHCGFKRFRKILVGDEKLNITYLPLRHLAAAIITDRKAGFIYGWVLNHLLLSVQGFSNLLTELANTFTLYKQYLDG